MDKLNLNEILSSVEKPARYIGGEFNEKTPFDGKFNYCICFPDVYEVGMSNLGIKIVCEAIDSVEGAYTDRCFAPWPDFGEKLKENDISLYALGNKKPLKTFDMLGFSLQYEMSYTNVLYMLDLAGIPLKRSTGFTFPRLWKCIITTTERLKVFLLLKRLKKRFVEILRTRFSQKDF